DTIASLSDFLLARVSTLAQRPRPTMPTLTGSVIRVSLLVLLWVANRGNPSTWPPCSPDGAQRHPGRPVPHFAALNAGYELLHRHHGGDVDLHQHAGPGKLADIEQCVRGQRIGPELLDAAFAVVLLVTHVGHVGDHLGDVGQCGAMLRE